MDKRQEFNKYNQSYSKAFFEKGEIIFNYEENKKDLILRARTYCEHPFEKLKKMMLPKDELNTKIETFSVFPFHNSIDIESSNLSFTETELFAIPKYNYFELLFKEDDFSYDLENLKNRLSYYDESIEKDYLSYWEDNLKTTIDKCKKDFKKELFNVENEFLYFDYIIEQLIIDFKHLIKINFNSNSYFSPIIKEFILQFSILLGWIISNFQFYLKDKQIKEIEMLISPRNNIRTFTINTIEDIEVFGKVVKQLKVLGLLEDKIKSTDLRDLFTGRKFDRYINWQKKIGTLYTFIKILKEKEVIKSSNVWEITSRYFIVQNKKITIKQIRNSKKSTDYHLVKDFEKIADFF